MSEEHDTNEEMITCPACTAEFSGGTTCPNCGAECPVEEADTIVDTAPETGEPANNGIFPESTPVTLTDGFNLDIDPTTLSQEQLIITINTVRRMVNEGKQIADATIAYGIKCIAILRQARPAKDPSTKAKPIARTMNLDDF